MKITNLETGKFTYHENKFEVIKNVYDSIKCNNIELEEGTYGIHFVFVHTWNY